MSSLKELAPINCQRIHRLVDGFDNLSLSSLQRLNLSSCKQSRTLPDSCGNLRSLQCLFISGCLQIRSLPDNCWLIQPEQPVVLVLRNFKEVQSLLDSFGRLSSVLGLHMRNCDWVYSLPDSLGSLKSIIHFVIIMEGCGRYRTCMTALTAQEPKVVGYVSLQTGTSNSYRIAGQFWQSGQFAVYEWVLRADVASWQNI